MSPSCLFESLQKSRLVLPSWLRITATKFSYPQNKHEFVSKKWLTMPPPGLIEILPKSRLVLPSKRLRIIATKFSYQQNRHECSSKKWLTTPPSCLIETLQNQGWCYHQKGCKLPQQNFHIHKIGMGMALKSDWLCPQNKIKWVTYYCVSIEYIHPVI